MSAWKCPECGAGFEKHGKGGERSCQCRSEDGTCQGLVCECGSNSSSKSHGCSQDDPCEEARCYHCGWEGRMPPLPFDPRKLKGWQKKAFDAGWNPPAGWRPT